MNLSTISPSNILTRILFASFASASVLSVSAHELSENRATLVQRDASHVSVTLFIALPEALHQTLAPERSFQEFVLTYASMPQASFQNALLKAERQLQSELVFKAKNGQPFTLDGWVWPELARVQTALQDRAMQALVAPGDHAHALALEIRVELRSAKPITSFQVQFPSAFKRVMAVSYRPKQVWVEPFMPSPAITF